MKKVPCKEIRDFKAGKRLPVLGALPAPVAVAVAVGVVVPRTTATRMGALGPWLVVGANPKAIEQIAVSCAHVALLMLNVSSPVYN